MSETVALRMLPPAGLLARLKRAGTDTGSLRLIERHARAYRRAWMVFVSGVFEPLFYLLSVGLGLGVLVGKVPGPAGSSSRTGSSSRPACSRCPP
jgi:lipooligosaccharide transport system permease protein